MSEEHNVLSLYDLIAKVLYTPGDREDSEPSIPQTHHQTTTKSGILSDYMSECSYCIVICVDISVHKTIVLNDSFLWNGNPVHENRSQVWQNRFRTINIKLIAYFIILNMNTILETHKWFLI